MPLDALVDCNDGLATNDPYLRDVWTKPPLQMPAFSSLKVMITYRVAEFGLYRTGGKNPFIGKPKGFERKLQQILDITIPGNIREGGGVKQLV